MDPITAGWNAAVTWNCCLKMSFLSAPLAARAQQNLDALRNGDLLPAVASPNHHQRERRVDRGEFAFHTSSRSLDFGVRELRADAAAVAACPSREGLSNLK